MQQRMKLRIPIPRIVESALLNPARKIFRSYLIRRIKQRMLWLDESDGRALVRDARVAKNEIVRGKLRPFAALVRIPFVRLVIENNLRSAGVRIIQQLLIRGDQFRLRFIDAIVDDDRAELLQVAGFYFGHAQLFGFDTQGVECIRQAVIKPAHVADP